MFGIVMYWGSLLFSIAFAGVFVYGIATVILNWQTIDKFGAVGLILKGFIPLVIGVVIFYITSILYVPILPNWLQEALPYVVAGIMGLCFYSSMTLSSKSKKEENEEIASKQKYDAKIILILAIVFAIPAMYFSYLVMSGHYDGETQQEEQVQEQAQNIKHLTFEEFKIAYNQNAQRFGSEAITDWEMSIGEKANSVKVDINDVTTISVYTNNDNDFTLQGVFLYMTASDDMIKTLESLTTLYTLLAIFEPISDDTEIMNLAGNAVQVETGVDYLLPSGLRFSRTSIDSTDVLMFRYE